MTQYLLPQPKELSLLPQVYRRSNANPAHNNLREGIDRRYPRV